MKLFFPGLVVALAAFAAPLFAQNGPPSIINQPYFDNATNSLIAVAGEDYIIIFVDAFDTNTPPSR